MLVKVRNAISPGKSAPADLRMKIRAASDNYTQAMVDLGAATTIQLSEAIESGFERLESQLRSGGGLSSNGETLLYVVYLIE